MWAVVPNTSSWTPRTAGEDSAKILECEFGVTDAPCMGAED